MARRGQKITIEDTDNDKKGETVDGEVLSPAEASAERLDKQNEDDVLIALAQLDSAGEVKWQITRLAPADRAGYVCTLTTAELSLETVRKRCGPGKYKCTGFGQDGRFIRQRTFEIAMPAEQSGTMLVPGGTPFDLEAFLRSMQGQRGAWLESLKFWAPLLIPVLTPFAAKMAEAIFTRRDTGLAESVQALVALKKMSDPPSQSSALEELKKYSQLKDLIGDLGGDKDATGSTWPDIVRDVAKQAAPLLGAFARARAGGAMPSGLGPIPIQEPPQGDDIMLQLLNWFGSQIPGLIRAATKNSDPGLYADYLADNVPDNVGLEQLHGILSREDWWQQFLGFAPAVGQHERWFRDMHRELLQQLNEALGKTTEGEKTPP